MTAYTPRHRRSHQSDCGRWRWLWPWWCSRPVEHDGPCALHLQPWRYR